MNRVNREFLLLAKVLDLTKDRIGGMLCSEKLDGVRAIWIPKARGKLVTDLPFANTEKDKKIPVATGLFSRYGKIIYAPKYFIDQLPTDRCLDGELWSGRQMFQQTISCVKKHDPVLSEWLKVKYYIFDSPTYGQVFADGRINNPTFKKTISCGLCCTALGITEFADALSFEFTHNMLRNDCEIKDGVQYYKGQPDIILHQQELLPFKTQNARKRLDELLTLVTDDGGEGLMLRHPSWTWIAERSSFLTKYKPNLDDEGIVIGYIAGKGKHQARLGSIRLQFKNIEFDVGGFTDDERSLTPHGSTWAESEPGDFTTEPISLIFPIGSTLTFAYRELTNDGIPKEGRYLRKRE